MVVFARDVEERKIAFELSYQVSCLLWVYLSFPCFLAVEVFLLEMMTV